MSDRRSRSLARQVDHDPTDPRDAPRLATAGEAKIDRPVPVPEALCHELERLQDAFVREWLFFEDDREHESEAAALRAREVPVLAVNLRPRKLGKLETGAPVWTFTSPGADLHPVVFLSKRWPLDYSPD